MNELNIDKAKLLDMFKGEDCRINWAASPAQGASHDAQGHEIRLQQSQAKLDDCLGQYLPALDLNQVALPAVYDEARRALERCIEPAEPHAIADQGAVLAAWAKRAKYPELESLAMRVRCHAIRKCGKLLLTYRAPGYRTDLAPPDGTSVTRPPKLIRHPGPRPRRVERRAFPTTRSSRRLQWLSFRRRNSNATSIAPDARLLSRSC